MAATGYGSLFLWSSFPKFEENAAVFLGAISTSALILFSCAALKLYSSHRKLYYFLIFSAVLYAAAGILGYLFYQGEYDAGKYSYIIIVWFCQPAFNFSLQRAENWTVILVVCSNIYFIFYHGCIFNIVRTGPSGI